MWGCGGEVGSENGAYARASCVTTLYALPAVCLAGVPLNMACILLFCSSACWARQRSTNLLPYLTALCTFDATQLALSLVVFVAPAYVHFMQLAPHAFFAQLSLLGLLVSYPFLMATNYASIWTITLICVQRYRAICHPIITRLNTTYTRSHKRRAVRTVCLVAATSLLVNSIRYWERVIVWKREPETNNWFITYNNTDLSRNLLYITVKDQITYPLFLYIVPATALMVLSGKIVLTLYRAKSFFKSHSHSSKLQRREHRTAFMIIAIILLFLFCNTGGLLIRVFRPNLNQIFMNATVEDVKEYSHFYFKWQFLADVSNLLFNVNGLCNPFIYFLFTQSFRDFKRRTNASLREARKVVLLLCSSAGWSSRRRSSSSRTTTTVRPSLKLTITPPPPVDGGCSSTTIDQHQHEGFLKLPSPTSRDTAAGPLTSRQQALLIKLFSLSKEGITPSHPNTGPEGEKKKKKKRETQVHLLNVGADSNSNDYC